MSHNLEFNLFSFYDRDHGARRNEPLKPQIEARLAEAGIDLDGGRIRLLCFPRILGYVFNPLSVYFCHHRDGSLRAILYEVSNTFGEQHGYLIPVQFGGRRGRCGKAAPRNSMSRRSLAMEYRYEFRLAAPDERLAVIMPSGFPDRDGPILHANLEGGARPRSTTRRYWRGVPALSADDAQGDRRHSLVEALRLWRKGLRLVPRPKTPPLGACHHLH